MTHLHSKFCYPICKATGGRDNPSKVAAMVKSFMEEPPEMEEIMRAEFDIVGSIKPWANDPDACKKIFYSGWRADDPKAICDNCRFPLQKISCPLTCKHYPIVFGTPADEAEVNEQDTPCLEDTPAPGI